MCLAAATGVTHLLVLNLLLHIVDGVRRLHIERDSLALHHSASSLDS